MRYLAFALPLLVLASSLHATIIHVPGDSTTIQGGINGAVNGDTVLVAPGLYVENIGFKAKAILLLSETSPEETIIAGSNPTNPDTASTVRFVGGEDSTSVLQGFTIRDGYGTNVEMGWVRRRGGGVLCYDSSPLIGNNIIIENVVSQDGGGIFIYGGTPRITNNLVLNNRSTYGSGIYLWTSSAIISNNTLDNNRTDYSGSSQVLIAYSSFPILENNIITSAPNGWGVGSAFGSSPTSRFNDVFNNSHGDYGFPPGEGDISEDPLYAAGDPFNYHLLSGSPCIDTGNPAIFDACLPPGLGGERSDMGVYGGDGNCGWPLPPEVDLGLSATGPTVLQREQILYFSAYIQNNRETSVEGDCWISVLLPTFNEVLVPDAFLNYANPLHGQVFEFVDINYQLFVPTLADTGYYQLIGRIGIYPNTIIDEESFGFQVIE